MEQFARSAMLLGKGSTEELSKKKIAVFGIGGVGSFAVEALARSGIGEFLLVDHDTIALSNINRQLHATLETIGQFKTKVMAQRIASINPNAVVKTAEVFVLPALVGSLLDTSFDYIIDAVDTVSAKIALAEYGWQQKIPVISCMGAGNKLDPTQFRVADISTTSVCPLCRIMRKELRKRGIPALKVVYSTEKPLVPDTTVLSAAEQEANKDRRGLPGSVSFVPPVAGLVAAGQVVKDLLGNYPEEK